MTETTPEACRYFLSYTGVKLPLTLHTELEPDKLEHRITYFCGYYDGQGRLERIQKMVYSEIEMEHRYHYDDHGVLRRAEVIDIDGEVTELTFDENGEMLG